LVAGLYLFTVNVRVNSGLLRLHIVQDDDPLVASTHYVGSGLQVFTDLTSGQQVWVKGAADCNCYHDESYSWMQFSGALIHKA